MNENVDVTYIQIRIWVGIIVSLVPLMKDWVAFPFKVEHYDRKFEYVFLHVPHSTAYIGNGISTSQPHVLHLID